MLAYFSRTPFVSRGGFSSNNRRLSMNNSHSVHNHNSLNNHSTLRTTFSNSPSSSTINGTTLNGTNQVWGKGCPCFLECRIAVVAFVALRYRDSVFLPMWYSRADVLSFFASVRRSLPMQQLPYIGSMCKFCCRIPDDLMSFDSRSTLIQQECR